MHDAFVGPTGCGKSALAKEKARAGLAAGFRVLVCDPLNDEWPCTWQTTSLEEFVAVAKQSRRCLLFVDEAGQSINRDKGAEWLFATARHWGHKTHVLSQGGTQMTPLMRGQISTLCLFGCTPGVAGLWAEEFNEPRLLAAADQTFPRFQFLFKRRFEPLRRLVVRL